MKESLAIEDSLDLQTMGKLQVIAGVGLLLRSHLVFLNPNEQRFEANNQNDFTQWWPLNIDQTFGRLICWITFSVGAEYFGKGVCLLHGLRDRIRFKQRILSYPLPEDETAIWAERVYSGKAAPRRSRWTYATIGPLVYEDRKNKKRPVFELLADKSHLSSADRHLLIAGYKLLASALRNRDAHFYTPGVREAHFYLVEKVLAPSLNILARCVPRNTDDHPVLSEWLKDAPSFISNIFD